MGYHRGQPKCLRMLCLVVQCANAEMRAGAGWQESFLRNLKKKPRGNAGLFFFPHSRAGVHTSATPATMSHQSRQQGQTKDARVAAAGRTTAGDGQAVIHKLSITRNRREARGGVGDAEDR
jgi:hypothetical protein